MNHFGGNTQNGAHAVLIILGEKELMHNFTTEALQPLIWKSAFGIPHERQL